MDDDRLNRIETALAHQDRQIQELHEVIHRQWKDIERLGAELERFKAALAGMEGVAAQGDGPAPLSVAEMAAMEKPPHY